HSRHFPDPGDKFFCQRIVLHQILPLPVRIHLIPAPAIHIDLIILLKLLSGSLLRRGTADDRSHHHKENPYSAKGQDRQRRPPLIPCQTRPGQPAKAHLLKSFPLLLLSWSLSLITHGFYR